MMIRILAGVGLAIVPFLTLMMQPAQAQLAEPIAPAATEAELPRFSDPNAPAVTQSAPANVTLTRDQAPLPLQTVYQTPIEQIEPAFADVPTTHWAYEAITRLYYSGIMRGYGSSQ
jgi:hypothetical protein